MLQPGTILDNKYEIEAVIGRGGFGHVYRARERLTGETVAIKELVPSFVDDQQMVQRFIQEARLTLRLSHPHIVRTYGIFQDRGTYYLAMEYLPGGSLADRLKHGALPIEEAVRIASELCEALEEAHQQDVVHCDIKPANVLFDEHGRVHLTDFGIAHVSAELLTRRFFTASGTAMGTVRYMAPEQLEGVRDDRRVDVYAVGTLLYEMLAGRPYLDFETESTPGAQYRNIGRIKSEPARPLQSMNPRVPEHLADVVERALSKAPGERFATTEGLRTALQQKVQRKAKRAPLPSTQAASDGERDPELEEDQLSVSPSMMGGLAEWLKGMPVWAGPAGGLLLIALLIGGGMWFQRVTGLGPAMLPTTTPATPSSTPTRAMATATATPRPSSEGVMPTEALSSASPVAMATSTLAPSALTSTPQELTSGSADVPTSTPRVGLNLLEPADGSVMAPDSRVAFRWEVPGTVSDPFIFRVKTDRSVDQALCEGSETSCYPRLPTGEYQWWVEIWSRDVMVEQSEHRMLYVRLPAPTYTPTPDATSIPPTSTPRLSDGASAGGLGNTWTRAVDGALMVYVPAGEFEMGSAQVLYGKEVPYARPVHTVELDGFWIDKYEVTNAQFAAFLNEKGNRQEGGSTWLELDNRHCHIEQSDSHFRPRSGYADHPAVGVSWYGARAYAQWVGGRLPSEAEWEKAARGTDGRAYPWGSGFLAGACNCGNAVGATTAVGTYSPQGDSPYGCADMAGNAWEWTRSLLRGYPYDPQDGRENPTDGGARVARGGALDTVVPDVRCAFRDGFGPDGRWGPSGFRVVVDP